MRRSNPLRHLDPAVKEKVSLNPAQRAAVEHGDGPLLVLAGAGSGKTRVITHRIARLVKRGIPPSTILAVSFTNKAAAEMKERMVPLVGAERAEQLWLSTFHRFGVRFLSEEYKLLGYPARFVIFDQGDSVGAVRDIARREGLFDRQLDLYAIQSRISLWKNAGIPPHEVPPADYEYDDIARSVYPHYESALRSMCAVDFDDLVALPARLLNEHRDVRDKWRQRFVHLLVDEFQDTNRVQLELVELLANERSNVCVVGDDDQSIYGWRGAEVGHILQFEKRFTGARVVKLEENYRSYEPILAVANAAIARAQRPRHEKVLRAARGPGAKVRLVTLGDTGLEAKFVVSEIRSLKREGIELSDVAVLYRSNSQARPLEEELRLAGYAYRMIGGTQFFDRKEVKDAVAYLRVIVNPRDELSLRRIANHPPRGIGDTTLTRLARWALVYDRPLMDAVERAGTIEDVPVAARRGAAQLTTALTRARAHFSRGRDLRRAAEHLFEEVGLRSHLQGEDKAARRRWANVEYILNALARHEARPSAERPSLGQFLTRLSLRAESDDDPAEDRVTLSSLHGSKGLEFRVVFFIGLNEGQLPHRRSTEPRLTEAAPTDVEEERRLFYVGVTRAKDLLYLCRPQRRSMRGKVAPLAPTRFLEGLPEAHLDVYEREAEAPVAADEAVEIGRALLEQLRGGPS